MFPPVTEIPKRRVRPCRVSGRRTRAVGNRLRRTPVRCTAGIPAEKGSGPERAPRARAPPSRARSPRLHGPTPQWVVDVFDSRAPGRVVRLAIFSGNSRAAGIRTEAERRAYAGKAALTCGDADPPRRGREAGGKSGTTAPHARRGARIRAAGLRLVPAPHSPRPKGADTQRPRAHSAQVLGLASEYLYGYPRPSVPAEWCSTGNAVRSRGAKGRGAHRGTGPRLRGEGAAPAGGTTGDTWGERGPGAPDGRLRGSGRPGSPARSVRREPGVRKPHPHRRHGAAVRMLPSPLSRGRGGIEAGHASTGEAWPASRCRPVRTAVSRPASGGFPRRGRPPRGRRRR
jgi:hypothetical protein